MPRLPRSAFALLSLCLVLAGAFGYGSSTGSAQDPRRGAQQPPDQAKAKPMSFTEMAMEPRPLAEPDDGMGFTDGF